MLQGPWNHAFYLLLDAALPPTPEPFSVTTFEKVGIDQFVQETHLRKNRPAAWSVRRRLDSQRPSPDRLSNLGPAQAPIFTMIILYFFAVVEGKGVGFATNQVKNDLGGILVKNWSVFLPATVINIGFCPPELRVLFLNCVFFGWVIYLSLFLNESEGEKA